MKIVKLGAVEEINITLKKLIIFTGKNNTGKTHTSYLLYGLISYIFKNNKFSFFSDEKEKEILNKLKDFESTTIKIEKEEIKNKFYDTVTRELTKEKVKKIAIENFKISKGNFEKLSLKVEPNEIDFFVDNLFNYSNKKIVVQGIEIIVNNNESPSINVTFINSEKNVDSTLEILKDHFLKEVFFKSLSNILISFPNTFYFPAERTGINVFKNELNENRLKIYDTFMNIFQFTNLKDSKEKDRKRLELLTNNIDLLINGNTKSPYPKPISDYINFLNSIKGNYDDSKNEITDYIRKEILQGKYEIDENGTINFREKLNEAEYKEEKISFHIVSSSIKSLFGLDYYIDKIAKKGDILIFDEPELSLHPENQVKLAYVIFMLIEKGIRIIISTHSDLCIRALTNIILDNKIKKINTFTDSDVRIYNFGKNKKVEEIDKISEISYFANFDDTIKQVQNEYDDLIEKL